MVGCIVITLKSSNTSLTSTINRYVSNNLKITNINSNNVAALKRNFSVSRSLKIDPASYSSLAFASSNPMPLASAHPAFLVLVGFAYVLYVAVIRVPEVMDYSDVDFDRLAGLVHTLESFRDSFDSFTEVVNQYFRRSQGDLFANYSDLRALYDCLNQIFTEVYSIEMNLDTLSDHLNNLEDSELAERFAEARENIRENANNLLRIMRSIERLTFGIEFFNKRLPNF